MVRALKKGITWGLQRSRLVALVERLRRPGRAIVLMYHRINDDGDPFFPALDVASFEAQLDYLGSTYRIEPMEGVLEWLRCGAVGPPRVALTIDDGYADTYDIALPRLRARGLPATLFLATDPPETGRPLWLDRVRLLLKHSTEEFLELPEHGLEPRPLRTTRDRLSALSEVTRLLKRSGPQKVDDVVGRLWERLGGGEIPDRLPVLSWEQVRELARGRVEVAAHTHRHYILSQLSRECAAQEITTSVDLIRERVGHRALGFAYPNGGVGDYTAETMEVVAELGLTWACTTRSGFATASSDRYELPRVYTAMDTLPLFACRVGGLTRLQADGSDLVA